MAENLPADVVPDEPLPEGVVADADAPLPQDVVPDEPAIPNLGVIPMPSRAQHQAALAQPPTAKDTAPGAYTLGGPEFSAFQATHSGVNGDQAAQALKLAKATEFAPEMVAQNLEMLQQRVDQTGFEDGLGAAPVLADYAAKGPVQASLVKDDMPALSALNAGFLDIGRQYLARKYMGMEPGPERDVVRGQIRNVERVQGQYEVTDPGIVAQTARMLPTVASYILSGVGGALAAGPAAPGGALAGPFMLNYQAHVGELYMRLQDAEEAHAAADPAYAPRSDKEIREYAKKGAIVSSTLLSTLGQPFLRGLPYATAALEKVGLGIVAKAGEDSVVKAAAGRLLELGAHTLSGAMTMAGMAVGDDAMVQKATTGKIDIGQATKVGAQAFKDALGPTAILSAVEPGRGFLRDVGRIRDARMEAVDLAAKVDQAKSSKLVQRAPEQAEKLFRIMADGSGSDTAYVAEFARLPGDVAHAVAVAAGPHAVGDDQATGGGVAVPVGKYLTQLKDAHESIKDNVRLSEDGLTPKEAAETKPDTIGALIAAKDWIVKTETDTPERVKKIEALTDRMRRVAISGEGSGGAGRVATEEEMKQAAADYAQMKPPGQEPAPVAKTPEFKDWFAGSKVTDKGGAPLKVFHGTSREFTEFQTPSWFTSDTGEASRYAMGGREGTREGAQVYPVHLSIKNPAEVSFTDFLHASSGLIEKLKAQGHDGMMIKKKPATLLGETGERTWYVPFSPEQIKPAFEAPKPTPAYEVPKPPKVTPDDEATASEHIEGKTIGEIRPSYYENAGRRAGERALKLATGPDPVGEKIREKYAEALGVSLDTVRNAVQGTFSADTLAQVRRKVRGAETEANRLEAGRMQTLEKLEGQHAMNVANRQADIQSAVAQQKNARVFADVAHDVRGEMDKLEAKLINKAGDSDFLGKLSMAGPEYRDAHDALFAAAFTGPEPQPQHGALEGLLARMQNEAQPIAFDVAAIRDLLADPKQWKDLTPPEARNFADAVANIRETAQRMNQIALSDRLASKRELIAQIGEEASTRRDMGAPPLTRSAMSLGERLLRAAGLYNASNLKPETIFQRLGETAQKLYEDTIIKGRNYKAELQGNLLRHFQEDFAKPMRALSKELAKPAESGLTVPKEVDLDDSRINGDTLAMAFLNLGTLSNEQTLLGGYGWEKQQVLDDIGKNLKPETVRLLQGILAYHDEKVWPLVREKAAKSGVTPPKIVAQPITITFADGTTETFAGGYFPRAPHPDALNVPSRGGDGIQNLNRYAQASVQASFTKTRVEGAEYPVDLNWSRYPAHLNAVFHYLAYDEPVRDLGRLLRDDEFRSIVRHRVGDEYLDQLDDDLKVWARGNAGDSSRTISLPSRMLASVLRTRTVSNALAMSTPIALGQESHVQYAITSGQISAKNGTIAMGRALIPEVWREAYAQSKELQFRADHYAAQFREALGGPGARSDIRRSIDVVAFAQMDMADRVLSHVIWDAAYNDALGQGLAHEDAVTQADRKLRLLMPTHNVMEMAPIVRDRGTIGALMLFRGLPNVVWNVEASLYDDAHQQMSAAIGPKLIAAAGGRAALNGARAVASIAVLHAMGRLLMGHGKTDEDGEGLQGWASWAEREAVSSQFSRLPFGRDIVEPYVNAFFHDKTMSQGTYDLLHGAHAAPDIAAIHSILRDLGTAFDEGKDTPDRVQAGINSLLLFGGVGARPLTRAGRYLYDLQSGARNARGPFDFAGGVVYGERDKQAKNPGTAIQDLISGEQ